MWDLHDLGDGPLHFEKDKTRCNRNCAETVYSSIAGLFERKPYGSSLWMYALDAVMSARLVTFEDGGSWREARSLA